MKDISTSSEKLSRKGIYKALRVLPNFFKFKNSNGVFSNSQIMNSTNNFISKNNKLKGLFNVDVKISV